MTATTVRPARSVGAVRPDRSADRPTGTRPGRLLPAAVLALLATSAVGGVVSVLTGANGWSDAWTSSATLAAPWPVLVVEVAAGAAAVRGRRRAALVGCAVLVLACCVSGLSGFFDGMLGRPDLSSAQVAAQYAVVATVWAVGAVVVARLVGLVRGR